MEKNQNLKLSKLNNFFTTSKIFILICFDFAVGIFFASKFIIPEYIIYYLWGILIVLYILNNFYFFSYKKLFNLIICSFLFLSLGILRFNSKIELNAFSSIVNTTQTLEGVVVEDIDIRENKQLITFRPNGSKQNILVTTTKTQNFFYGDYLVVFGQIKLANNFEDFDYRGYLERYNIYSVMSYPKIFILKSNRANFVKYYLFKIKYAFSERIQKYIRKPQSDLALGVLIGAKRGLPTETIEAFNRTGTSHIVAVSGYNIAIIVAFLSLLAWIFGRKVSFWLSVLIIFSFIIITGASASVIRASVMGILLLLGFNIGRLYSAVPALVFAGTVMLFLNPKILYWDIGFQLSFLATLGLIMFMPLWDTLTENWPKFFGLKSIFFATISATVATMPISLPNFEQLSLISILANLLVLPAVPASMLFGFLSIVPVFSSGFAFLANIFLTYILLVVNTLSGFNFAIFSIQSSFILQIILWGVLFSFYGFLKWQVWKKNKNSDRMISVDKIINNIKSYE